VRLRYLVALASATLLVTACGSGGNTPSSSATNAPVHIELVSVGPDTDSTQTILRALMDGFARTHPGSTFKNTYIPQAQLDQKLQLLSAQNALPEMFFAPGTPAAQTEMATAGKALNIENTLSKLGVLDTVNPTAAQIMRNQQGGTMYALPVELNIEGFWYNKKIFAENAVTPPATWADLVSAAAGLSARGIQPFAASGVQGWPLTRLVSGYLFRDQGPDALKRVADGQAKLTDPAYVKAAQAVADLGARGYFGKGFASLDYQPAEDLFLQGKAAMFYMGSWAVADFNDPAKNKIGGPDSIGFFPIPTVAGGSGSIDQTPMNAGLPIMVSAKKYNAAPGPMGAWLKYLAQNYAAVAMAKRSVISGFVLADADRPATLPSTTTVVTDQIKSTKQPLGWFESLMSAKAQQVAQTNAPSLVNGGKSAAQFMSLVQAALNG
jgi:raffinose/stachyose/melibiose transport system substrate-binding protein